MNLRNNLIILFSLTFTTLFAQGEFGNVTPQTSDFVKYGEIPISLFTGKMNFEIPIYEIKDKDFNLPISAVYTSDGFKPAKRSGFIGLDWFLNVGGAITREVYGVPDDNYPSSNGTNASELMGYWVASGKALYNNEELWDISDNIFSIDVDSYELPLVDGFYYDAQPDLFQLNCGNHNLRFMIDNNRNIKTNVKGYKVLFDGFSTQNKSTLLPVQSSIMVKSPDGYIYVFGGELSSLEFSFSFTPGTNLAYDKNPTTILAWHLTKIIAPNGRTMKFNYVNVSLTNSNINNKKDSPIWQSSKKVKGTSTSYSTSKMVILDNIEIEDTRTIIKFYRSQEAAFSQSSNVALNQFFTNPYPDFNVPSYELDSVVVMKDGSPLHSYAFGYTTKDKRRFLTSFKQADGGLYSFEYLHPYLYPEPETTSADSYGFWNGNNSQHSYGLLNKISYPTGGFTQLAYEKSFYGCMVDTYVYNNLGPARVALDSTSGYTGGGRICKITNYESANNIASEKEYYYLLNYSKDANIQNLTSSGILYQAQPYEMTATGAKSYIESSWSQNYDVGEPEIGYSYVIEKNSDGSFVINRYTDWGTNPDDYITNTRLYSSEADLSLFVFNGVNKSTTNAQKRGLLLEKKYIDKTGLLVRSENYKYSNVNQLGRIKVNVKEDIFPEDVIVSVKGITGGAMAKIIRLQNHLIVDKMESIDGVSRVEKYDYNDYDLLSKKALAIGTNDSIINYYKYPVDFASTTSSPTRSDVDVLDWMVTNNNITPVVEEKEKRNARLLKTNVNIYKYPEDGSVLDLSFKALLDTVKSSIGDAPLETKKVYRKYDGDNPVFITEKEVENTVYIWGYDGQYPIAEIRNATYNEVVSNLDASPTELLTIPDYSALCDLRSKLPNASITLYTYKPGVGVTSIQSPRGLMTYYSYDSSDRLRMVRDHDLNILNKYEYAYHGASVSPVPTYSDLSLSLTAEDTVVYNVRSFAKVNVTGGSGEYTCTWSLKTVSGTVLSSTIVPLSPDYILHAPQTGSLVVQCTVTDNQSGKSGSASKSIYCLPFKATISSESSCHYRDTTTASISIVGGSGDFECFWYVLDENGNYIFEDDEYNTNSIRVPWYKVGTFTLNCDVYDLTYGDWASLTRNVTCSCLPLETLLANPIVGTSRTIYASDNWTSTLAIEGGSGIYQVSWSLKNSTGTVINNGTANSSTTISCTCPVAGNYTLCCTVLDSVTGKIVNHETSFVVSVRPGPKPTPDPVLY